MDRSIKLPRITINNIFWYIFYPMASHKLEILYYYFVFNFKVINIVYNKK